MDEVETKARDLLAARGRPRRRARPRIASPLADAEQHMIDLPTGQVAAWRLGEGPAVLFIHGWEDDNALWGPAMERFAAWGRPVVAFDLPGHGFSTAEDASVSGVGLAALEVAKALGPIHAVVGHSFGCAAIIRALNRGLETRKAVLIASPVPRTGPRRPLEADEAEPEVIAKAEELRQAHAVSQSAKVEAALQAMTIPALVIHSLDDPQTPFGNAQRLTQLWPGAELLPVDELGHRFVAQDGDVLERVVAFVEDA